MQASSETLTENNIFDLDALKVLNIQQIHYISITDKQYRSSHVRFISVFFVVQVLLCFSFLIFQVFGQAMGPAHKSQP